MRRFRSPVRRRADGAFDVRLDADARALLGTLGAQVRDLIEHDEDGGANVRRLFPPTYGDDAVRDAEFQVSFGDELRQSRLAAIDVLCTTAGEERIDEAQALAWMQAINAVRLVLGTHLDVDEEPGRVSPRHPQAALHYAYEYLGSLLYVLVEAVGS